MFPIYKFCDIMYTLTFNEKKVILMKTMLTKVILGISLATLSSIALAHPHHEHGYDEEGSYQTHDYDRDELKQRAKEQIQEMNRVLRLNLTREQFQKMWKATTEYEVYQYEATSDEDIDFYNEKYMDYMDSVLTEKQKANLIQTPSSSFD